MPRAEGGGLVGVRGVLSESPQEPQRLGAQLAVRLHGKGDEADALGRSRLAVLTLLDRLLLRRSNTRLAGPVGRSGRGRVSDDEVGEGGLLLRTEVVEGDVALPLRVL